MFIREKLVGKYTYYYLVETYRIGGKPRQRVIKYLGKDKPSPEELKKILSKIKR